ncbi:hypothetical protein K437DRAFT_262014 [Tilletiaria anomala UBC 951]|uniref:Uncharacterized protein n=1 Tax=Tilletiaria anomala (strain ATCC 24038 / CBS 436.72 / UBC 951) TaxID=1037660 RepID=A0A066W896_TILAU|nr:uncharacterized protein K437DRAFT_262014 [Tilletiaria anomala UBC 951]KDN49946.1 hypothetical protein K437DRAFT_262014 [Tilletiaria anomala UBC 951]
MSLRSSAPAECARSTSPLPLPLNEVGLASKNAQLRGTGLGVGTGFLSALVAHKSLRLSPKASLLSGLISGSFVAWYGSRQFMVKNLRTLEDQLSDLQGSSSKYALSTPSPAALAREGEAIGFDLRSGAETRFEAGTGGMHEFTDRGASTRGDH